ncbi:hypothetical protein HPG69_017971 [Diceros bicornis minor]|uniref:Uncharacterized protein n=1 Tax=Diceros bicornis minor TaxID=77932 RepID=A0A7J7F402_DICBM|nr:hypothetical protein HPG69_017971 [Diceros bicornis minor]
MSTSRKLKSHGMRRGKNRAPYKGVKRGGGKRKYRKGSLKSRKRGDDGVPELGRLGEELASMRSLNLTWKISKLTQTIPE